MAKFGKVQFIGSPKEIRRKELAQSELPSGMSLSNPTILQGNADGHFCFQGKMYGATQRFGIYEHGETWLRKRGFDAGSTLSRSVVKELIFRNMAFIHVTGQKRKTLKPRMPWDPEDPFAKPCTISIRRNSEGILYFSMRFQEEWCRYLVYPSGEQWLAEHGVRDGDKINGAIVHKLRELGAIYTNQPLPARRNKAASKTPATVRVHGEKHRTERWNWAEAIDANRRFDLDTAEGESPSTGSK